MRPRIVLLIIVAAGVMVTVAYAVGAATLSPPVIHEPFTQLPCSGQPGSRNTLQQEGCAEQQILKTNAQIDALSKSVFSVLADNAAKRRFVKGAGAWLLYRRADCLSVSDVFEGGTQSPVLYAQCEAARNAQRIRDLRTFRNELRPSG
jgi:uncharacterized protein YecT (DUF1311 family)